jgi:G3E family GTPase
MSIPIYLLTGTLGSGKTTLLNNLLQLPQFKDGNTCLIINEFGELGVDGALVESGDHPKFELNKGSIFCICIKTDFIATLQAIANDVKPDCLLVEATGMAEPRDVQDFIDVPDLAKEFHIEANVCIVDALDFIRVAPMLRAARQLATWADTILNNPCDLVDDS